VKILYFPCHVTLEYDEITLLTELGHEVFSTGLYGDLSNISENELKYKLKHPQYSHQRPHNISGYKVNSELLQEYKSHPENTFDYDSRAYKLSMSFLNKFDAIYVNYDIILCRNIKTLVPHKLVIFNTVSQANAGSELHLLELKNLGVRIIRFYQTERMLPYSAVEDALIPQFVDELEYNNWHGSIPEVLAVCRGVTSRPVHTNMFVYQTISNNFKSNLVGPGNEGLPGAQGALSYEDLKNAYRSYRLFFNLGTKPGGMVYTCIEALMTGCPVVSVGKRLGGSFDVGGGDTNAIPLLITNGVNGFYSDDIVELCHYCNLLLQDHNLAKQMSIGARELALKHFSKSIIKDKWRRALDSWV
jgi:hypothetical protein